MGSAATERPTDRVVVVKSRRRIDHRSVVGRPPADRRPLPVSEKREKEIWTTDEVLFWAGKEGREAAVGHYYCCCCYCCRRPKWSVGKSDRSWEIPPLSSASGREKKCAELRSWVGGIDEDGWTEISDILFPTGVGGGR